VLRDLVQTQVSTVEGRRGGRAEGGKEGRLEAMKRRKEGGGGWWEDRRGCGVICWWIKRRGGK